MGKYRKVILDRDCAFDVDELNVLLTQGKSILNEAIELSRKMEGSISRIYETFKEIDGRYKVHNLGLDITELSGKLESDIYQDTIDRMDTVLNKLMDEIPSCDSRLAEEMSNIQEVLDSVKGRISELQGFWKQWIQV